MFEPRIITDISHLPKNIETNLAELEPIIAEKCEREKRSGGGAKCGSIGLGRGLTLGRLSLKKKGGVR